MVLFDYAICMSVSAKASISLSVDVSLKILITSEHQAKNINHKARDCKMCH